MSPWLAVLIYVAFSAGGMAFSYWQGIKEGRDRERDDAEWRAGSEHADE